MTILWSSKLSLSHIFVVNFINKFSMPLQFTLITHDYLFWCFAKLGVEANIKNNNLNGILAKMGFEHIKYRQ